MSSTASIPSDDVLARLRSVSPSTLGHLRDHGLIAGLDPLFRPIRFAGVARTVVGGEYDSPGLNRVIDEGDERTVIVISRPAGTRRTTYGGVVGTRARARGIAGLVIDGPVTDSEQLVELGTPIYHRGVTPLVGRSTDGLEIVDVPVVVGGVVVNPGDVLFGDNDGVAVLSPYEVEPVLEVLEDMERREVGLRASLLAQGADR
ncbi:RraA family protein [Luteimicrobium album]|nr:RraA family protein [Luteimicrobium album]